MRTQFGRSAIGNVVSLVSGAFIDTEAAAQLAYPDHLNLGVVQRLTPALDIQAGLTWTQWSSFKQIDIVFANPSQPASVMPQNWRDTVTAALGMTYLVAPGWTLRAGISFDQTPIPSAGYRTPRLPDANRIMPSIGAGYPLSDRPAHL